MPYKEDVFSRASGKEENWCERRLPAGTSPEPANSEERFSTVVTVDNKNDDSGGNKNCYLLSAF